MWSSQDRKYKRIVCKTETQVDWGEKHDSDRKCEYLLVEETGVRTRRLVQYNERKHGTGKEKTAYKKYEDIKQLDNSGPSKKKKKKNKKKKRTCPLDVGQKKRGTGNNECGEAEDKRYREMRKEKKTQSP